MNKQNETGKIQRLTPPVRKFLPPKFFLDWVIDQLDATDLLERFSGKERDKKRELELFGLTADDLAVRREYLTQIADERESILAGARELILVGLQRQLVVARGFPSPSSPRLYLPPRVWHFLSLDFKRAAAAGGGLEFYGVEIAEWKQLDAGERAEAKAGIERADQWLADREWAARKPIEAPPGATPERPLHVAVDREAGDNLRRGARTKAAASAGGRQNAAQRRPEDEARRAAWRDEAQEMWDRNSALSITVVARWIVTSVGGGKERTIRKYIADLKPQK